MLGFLLLANITLLLSFFVFGERADRKVIKQAAQGGAGFLATELSMTKEQQAKHKELREVHFKNIKPLWAEIQKTKDSLYNQLNNPSFDEQSLQEMTDRLAEKNKRSDQMMFRYFKELRNVFTPEQQVKFDSLVPEMVNKRGSGWNKGGGHAPKK